MTVKIKTGIIERINSGDVIMHFSLGKNPGAMLNTKKDPAELLFLAELGQEAQKAFVKDQEMFACEGIFDDEECSRACPWYKFCELKQSVVQEVSDD